MNEQTKNQQTLLGALQNEASRIEEDATYSSKGHFNAAATWERRQYWIGIPATILAVLTGATLNNWPIVAVVISPVTACLTALLTFLKPSKRADIHRAAASDFLALRNNIRMFKEIELLLCSQSEELYKKLQAFSDKRNELNKKSPAIPQKAFHAARKGIEEGEATHKIDKEQ